MNTWELLASDAASGRQIYKKDVPPAGTSNTSTYGTYDFKVAADFEVRDAEGRVLLTTHGSASGEYYCCVFLWFVDGSDGTQVRLEESNREDHPILDVPDTPQAT
ncbi:MAG: hypothetical protein AAF641_14065 [Pseudomonadota bacterium]